MTNDMNMDEFDQDNLENTSGMPESAEGGLKKTLMEAWRTQPLFKLIVIMAVVGVAIAGALGVFSSPPPPPASKMVGAPGLNEAPGGKASPYFIEQNQQANAERADQAMRQGTSALPTPVGQNLDLGGLDDKKKEDPLAEFRAETERLKHEMTQERQQNAQQMQVMQQQIQQKPAAEKEDDSMAQAMQRQMQQMMEAWVPGRIKVVEGKASKDVDKRPTVQSVSSRSSTSITQTSAARSQQAPVKNLVEAGSVNYGQMLMEANSDIPGPILAQVLSGPFSGGRAIGRFQTMYDFLVIHFNIINYKGKDYPVNILALNPDTTLGGLATDVDHRYFDRVVLPAAAAFTSQFGSTLGQGGTTTTVTDNAILIEQAKASYKEAIFSGFGNAAQSVSQFLQQEASRIKPLIRVATGTPLGLFFLNSVKETPDAQSTAYNPWQSQAAESGYQLNNGLSTIPGYGTAYTGGTTGYNTRSSYPSGTMPMGYNPSAGGFYPSSARQQVPGSSLTIIAPGQNRY